MRLPSSSMFFSSTDNSRIPHTAASASSSENCCSQFSLHSCVLTFLCNCMLSSESIRTGSWLMSNRLVCACAARVLGSGLQPMAASLGCWWAAGWLSYELWTVTSNVWTCHIQSRQAGTCIAGMCKTPCSSVCRSEMSSGQVVGPGARQGEW